MTCPVCGGRGFTDYDEYGETETCGRCEGDGKLCDLCDEPSSRDLCGSCEEERMAIAQPEPIR